MKRGSRKVMLAAGLIVFPCSIVFSQYWAEREYGIGLAGTLSLADQPPGAPTAMTLPIYASPSERSQQVAQLRSDSLSLFGSGETVPTHERLLEYAYEESGFPILEYNADSSWMKVSLNCWDRENRSTGWIRGSSAGLKVLSWRNILEQADAFFFLKPQEMKVYSDQGGQNSIKVDLDSIYSRPDYQLYRLRIQDRWMQVELETPSSYCRSDEEVLELFGAKPRKRVVWIEFLDERGRPTIFYNTRGC